MSDFNFEQYYKENVIQDNGYVKCKSLKSALIISLFKRITYFEDSVFYNGHEIIRYVD
jgi:uncharacterized protein YbcI